MRKGCGRLLEKPHFEENKSDMKTLQCIFIILALMASVAVAVAQDQQPSGQGRLVAGMKWAGERIVTRPNRLLTNVSLEVTGVSDVQIEGVFRADADEELSTTVFKSTVEKGSAGLVVFRFKNDSGLEHQCELQADGRLIISRPGKNDVKRPVPFILNPVN